MQTKRLGSVAPCAALVLGLGLIGLSASSAKAQPIDQHNEWEKPYYQQSAWDQKRWEDSLLNTPRLSKDDEKSAKEMKHSQSWRDNWQKSDWAQESWDEEMMENGWTEFHKQPDYVRLSPPDLGHPIPIKITCPQTAVAMDSVQCEVRCGDVDYDSSGPNHVTLQIKFAHGKGAYSTDNKTWTTVSPGADNSAVITIPLENGHHHGKFYVRSLDSEGDKIEMTSDNAYTAIDPKGRIGWVEISTSMPTTIADF